MKRKRILSFGLAVGSLCHTGCGESIPDPMEEAYQFGMLLALLGSRPYIGGYQRARLRDVGNNTVVFEAPYRTLTDYRTWFVARKCLQGFAYDAATNSCTEPAGPATDEAGADTIQTKFQYCSENTNSCNHNGQLNGLGRSEAFQGCEQIDELGRRWQVARAADLSCLFGRTAARETYSVVIGRTLWANEARLAERAVTIHYDPELYVDRYGQSARPKTERLHLLCVTEIIEPFQYCLPHELP